MKKLTFLFVMATFMSGCASFYCSRYPNDNYSPTVAERIPIYNNYPPTPYEIIGEVGGNGAPASSWRGMGKRIRQYAAQIGGDAIVIQSQETPYVGTYNTPTTATTTSSAYGSAYGSGNYIYGHAYGQSQTTIYPGSSIPMYGKSVRAFVIKFKQQETSFDISTTSTVSSKTESELLLTPNNINQKLEGIKGKDIEQVDIILGKPVDYSADDKTGKTNSCRDYLVGGKKVRIYFVKRIAESWRFLDE